MNNLISFECVYSFLTSNCLKIMNKLQVLDIPLYEKELLLLKDNL